MWSTDVTPNVRKEQVGALRDATKDETSFIPGPGGTRFHVMHFPPDAVMMDPRLDQEATVREQRAQMPKLAERFAPNGIHDTPTLDYVIVIDGEVWLELDSGEQTCLRAGDVVIQQGTAHAWRNRSDAGVMIAFVMVGARA